MNIDTNNIDFYNNDKVIEINHLSKSFGNNHVLRDINLELKKGENIVILGKSGCGKSVLIKCIVGLLNFDSGLLKIFGKDISNISRKEFDIMREKIGFVFQSSALYDSMSVRDNLAFPLRKKTKHTKKEIQYQIEKTLESVGLKNTIELMPSELSGGMRKRIGLARALILQPEIILYDEPTTGLDPITAKEIINLMLEIKLNYKTSSIIISHDMICAKLTSDKMFVLINGVFKENGKFEQLKKSNDKDVKAFFNEE